MKSELNVQNMRAKKQRLDFSIRRPIQAADVAVVWPLQVAFPITVNTKTFPWEKAKNSRSRNECDRELLGRDESYSRRECEDHGEHWDLLHRPQPALLHQREKACK